jgi:hypothetical protein
MMAISSTSQEWNSHWGLSASNQSDARCWTSFASSATTTAAHRPCLSALARERCLPSSVFGPVLLAAFLRFAANRASLTIMGGSLDPVMGWMSSRHHIQDRSGVENILPGAIPGIAVWVETSGCDGRSLENQGGRPEFSLPVSLTCRDLE